MTGWVVAASLYAMGAMYTGTMLYVHWRDDAARFRLGRRWDPNMFLGPSGVAAVVSGALLWPVVGAVFPLLARAELRAERAAGLLKAAKILGDGE